MSSLRGKRPRRSPDPEAVRSKVGQLQRKHNERAALNEDEERKIFWSKKVERDLRTGAGVREDGDQADLNAELQRVIAKREQNEAERAQRQEDVGLLERQRLAADALKEAAREEQFHLAQSITRARKRLDEDRAQPIDQLVRAVHLHASHPFSDPAFQPHHVFEPLRVQELEALIEDVTALQEVDIADSENARFWAAAADLLRRLVAADRAAERNAGADHTTGTDAAGLEAGSVAAVVEAALAGSLSELNELEGHVAGELADPSCPDPHFWMAVQPRIQKRKAEVAMEEVFAAKRKAAEEAAAHDAQVGARGPPADDQAASMAAPPAAGCEEGDADEPEGELPAWMQQSDGRYSPQPHQLADTDDTELLLEDDDKELLLNQRLQVQRDAEAARSKQELVVRGSLQPLPTTPPTGPGPSRGDADGEQVLRATAAMGTSADEIEFRGLVPLEAQEYWWRERYKPRKPKFFNKVHTGYDWNKYNRAHYDVDNPPPKVVQGYKFNIFYPDLVDKSKAPAYSLLPEPSGDDATELLRFTAGPPYEDVAFRIVKKEWDTGPRKGFRNVFDRGMLQLYFNFKRTPYRR